MSPRFNPASRTTSGVCRFLKALFVSTVESHLASNVYKSKLAQKDLQVAKKLQEEEDEWAKVQSQKQHTEL